MLGSNSLMNQRYKISKLDKLGLKTLNTVGLICNYPVWSKIKSHHESIAGHLVISMLH